ncbi:MAG: NDP-sugar synthase [Methanomassiliicoccus sp.]|nr:NDP-sugar synthase [Methanomassiliicoccus sp.]
MSGDISAVILAGGEGTRLRPLTNTRPKPLLPVLGRPCLEYIIRSLADAGVGTSFLTCGYRSQDMVDALGDGRQFGLDMRFAFEDHPAGTAGAVKLLEDKLDGTVVVVSGDVLADVDVRSLVETHRSKGALATMALTTVDRPEEFGIVGLDDDGRIVRFKEKPRTEEVFSNLINAGIYVLESRVLRDVPAGEKYDFSKQLFPKLLERGEPLYGMPLSGLWKDIGRPRDLLDANLRMAERKGRPMEVPGAVCTGNIVATEFRAEGCEVHGPAYIGEGAVVGAKASLSSCAVGDRTVIGAGTRIDDSFLMDGCAIGDGCVIRGSLLGRGCAIGGGAVLTNVVLGDGVRLDAKAEVRDRTIE